MAIHFFEENVTVVLKQKKAIKQWLKETASENSYSIKELNYIFCSDPYLLEINLRYLNHDTFTDIITFDQSEKPEKIEGDIYISIDRVKENAKDLETSYEEELFRVIIHGLLHLCGFTDKSKLEKEVMRNQECRALKKLYQKIQTTVPRGTVKK